MLYIDGLLNDKEFTLKEKREVITEALEAKNLPIDYIMSLDITNPTKVRIILESMELAIRKNPKLANKKWLAYVRGCMESRSDKVKEKAMRVLDNISPGLAQPEKRV